MDMKRHPPLIMRAMAITKKRQIARPITGEIHQEPHIGPIHGPGPTWSDTSFPVSSAGSVPAVALEGDRAKPFEGRSPGRTNASLFAVRRPRFTIEVRLLIGEQLARLEAS